MYENIFIIFLVLIFAFILLKVIDKTVHAKGKTKTISAFKIFNWIEFNFESEHTEYNDHNESNT